MYCDACGARADKHLRCPACGTPLVFVWLAGAGVIVWALDFALYISARVLYEEIFVAWSRLGADLPASFQLFFRVSDVAYGALAPVAATTPAGLWMAFEKRKPGLRRWSRLYLLGATVAAAWSVLALAMWYLTAITPIGKLR